MLTHDWRFILRKINLVARYGSTLVFVEVKCHTRDRLYPPELAVDTRKQIRLRRVAQAYLAVERPRFSQCRFDVVSVVAGNPVRLSHVVDAF